MKFEELTPELLIDNPKGFDSFTQRMGIVVRSIENNQAIVDMILTPELENPIGSIHGGALFTLADVASGLAAGADGTKVTTLESNMHYLKAAFPGTTEYVRGTATIKKAGKKIRVVEVEITDDKEELLCIATFGFFVL